VQKRCPKCLRRQGLAEFQHGLSLDELLDTRGRGSRFCHDCRTTPLRCTACERDRSIVEFSNHNGGRYGRCKECHSAIRRRYYARAAEYFAEHERAAGRDPADHRGYRHYSRDPDDVLLDAKRRRAARLRDAIREPYDRIAVFDRDDWHCWECGVELDEDNATVDHVVPIAAGGADTFDNVRAACRSCNSRGGGRPAPCPLAVIAADRRRASSETSPRTIGTVRIIKLPRRRSWRSS
jgi:5-methylcytosine-specific restriction endonuclease McrA